MWQSRRTICFLTMTSTEHRIQAEAETRSPEGLQQRSKASAGSGGRNGLRAPNLNCENVRVRAATTPEPEPPGSQVLRLAESRRGAEVLPLPAETSREAPKCCAWQHRGGGPRTRSGTVQSLKCCPCQQKRAARLKSAAPGSIKGGALGHRPEPEVLPLPETSREAQKCCTWQHERGAPRNALGHRPEPEVLPLPAETSREARKCCIEGGGPETRSGTVQSLKCCPCQQKRAARLESAAPGSIKGGGPETRSGTVQRA